MVQGAHASSPSLDSSGRGSTDGSVRQSRRPSDASSASAERRRSRAQQPHGGVTEDDIELREEICKQIFGDAAACIVKDFSCAWDQNRTLMHGRMYLTAEFLCFYSNWFGYESKVMVAYKNVTRCSKGNTAIFIPNAIIVHEAGDKSYVFRNFWERDECFGLIQRLVGDAAAVGTGGSGGGINDQSNGGSATEPSSASPSPDTARRQRQKSAPCLLDGSSGGGGNGSGGVDQAAAEGLPLERAHQQGATRSQRGSMTPPPPKRRDVGLNGSSAADEHTRSVPASPVVPAHDDRWSAARPRLPPRAGGGSRGSLANAATAAEPGSTATAAASATAGAAAASAAAAGAKSRAAAAGALGRGGAAAAAESAAAGERVQPLITWEDASEADTIANLAAFEAAAEKEGPPLAVVVSAEFPVSVRDFWLAFMADGAPYGLPDFHLTRGDWEVDTSVWQPAPQGSAAGAAGAAAGTAAAGTAGAAAAGVAAAGAAAAGAAAAGAAAAGGSADDGAGTAAEVAGGSAAAAASAGLVRSIRFRTPLNLSFMAGPSQCRTLKKQRIRSFGSAGLIVDTVTTVEDRIPLSDHFCVEDRWVVQPVADGERCRATVRWRCAWQKFTVLKGFIEAKCKGDVRAFNEAFVRGMADYLAGAAPMISRERSRTVMGLGGGPSVASVAYDDIVPDSVKDEISRVRRALTPLAAPLRVATFFFLVYTVLFWAAAQISEEPRGPPPPVQLESLYADWGRSNLVLQGVQERAALLAAHASALRQELASAGRTGPASPSGGSSAGAAAAAAAAAATAAALAGIDAKAGAMREEARAAAAAVQTSVSKIHTLLVDLVATQSDSCGQ